MPVRHSVLALYRAVGDALTDLNDTGRSDAQARQARFIAKDFTGLTGSSGEVGWAGELFRYFSAHPTRPDDGPATKRQEPIPDQPLTPPTIEQALADFTAIAQGISPGETLQPSWAIRAIEAAYVSDRLTGLLDEENQDDRLVLLGAVLGACPAYPTGIVGDTAGKRLAEALRKADVGNPADLYRELRRLGPTANLHPAVSTAEMDARLRKVKDEYCAVVSTSVDWPHMKYEKLKKGINPVNWSLYFDGFFCKMTASGPDVYGWTRIREEVSGECARYRLRTPLKFWSALRADGLFLNYDFDLAGRDDWPEADEMVIVDNGYIWITPLDPNNPQNGVRVRTSKELLISGMSATALAVMAMTMGFATNANDMFLKLDNYDGPLTDFVPSNPTAQIPPPDTSATWPPVIPQLPGDIRDEMCRDNNELMKRGLDIANGVVADFSTRWNDGIDKNDFEELNDVHGAELNTFINEVFDTATSNFRPKP